MKHLDKPAKSVFDILNVLKEEAGSDQTILDLESAAQVLIDREFEYAVKVPNNTLFEIKRDPSISIRVDKKKMVSFYKYRLLGKPKGRSIYEEIILSAPYNICPYCTIRTVKTIDHFLPKSKYPSFSITPINLIPCCTECNTDKKINYPTKPSDQTFHPYFDIVDNEIWINAQLMQTEPLSFQYKVIRLDTWDDNKFERANAHFKSYNINQLFSNEANRELRGMQLLLKNLYKKDRNLLKMHLQETFNTNHSGLGILDWKTLMYQELLVNDWFLNGCIRNSFFV